MVLRIELIEPHCQITLGVKLNSLLAGLPMPVLNVEVKDLQFRGTLTIDAKLKVDCIIIF